jgi:tetratricopeptide (TPR) repeat protein
MLRNLILAAILTSAASLSASALVDRYYAGKKEEDICKEFLKKLPESMKAWVATKAPPRATLVVNKIKVYAELCEVQGKGDTNIWGELVKKTWYTNSSGALFMLNDAPNTRFRIKNTDVPAADVGGWFDGKRDDPALLVGLCVWLARNNELTVANQRLTELVNEKKDLRADVEAWLCEKYKWTLPEQGLRMIAVRELAAAKGYGLLLTEEAHKEHLSKLDTKAKEALANLVAARGDTQGELGTRKKAPTERLDELSNRCDRFAECFRDTPAVNDIEQMKMLEKLKASLDADLEVVKNIFDNAEGYLKQDPGQAAKSYDKLTKADPMNPTWRSRLAYAYHLEGGLHFDGGCNDAKSMKLAADLYKTLCEEFPLNGNLFTFAGASYYATGERDRAKKYLERAVVLTEAGDSERDFAERLLKNLK